MGWTFYNSNGQRLSSAATNISVLDIDGATDIGAAIVDADLFIVDDGAGGTNRKTAASRIKTYIGGLVLINTAAASDSASLTITGLDSTYDTYLITGADLRPASDDPRSYIRLGDSSGIDSGASDYGWHSSIFTASSASYSAEVDASAAQIQLAAGVGNATGEGSGFALWLHCPGDSLTRPIISGTHIFYNSSTAIKGGVTIAERTAVIAVDRVQFFFSSGNISTGRLTVWGLAHA